MNGNGDSIEFGFGDKKITARGGLTAIILVLGLCTVAIGYMIHELKQANVATASALTTVWGKDMATRANEHDAILRSEDRLACIVSMTPEERQKFRQMATRSAFAMWCPWMEDREPH